MIDYNAFFVKNINWTEYDEFISLGGNCPSAMTLQSLNLRKNAYPFDWCPTTPQLILKYIQDNISYYPEPGQEYNKDGCWFGHFYYNYGNDFANMVSIIQRRFERFDQKMKEGKKILFLYQSEGDIYNQLNKTNIDTFEGLVQLRDYLIQKYNHNNFTIAAIFVNKWYPEVPNIISYKIEVDPVLINPSSDNEMVWFLHRDVLLKLCRQIFGL